MCTQMELDACNEVSEWTISGTLQRKGLGRMFYALTGHNSKNMHAPVLNDFENVLG